MNAVILPNGKVLAEGGSVNNESPDPAGKQADIYDPVVNTMSSGGTASYSRLYHSTALLLPDATVVSMGSNPGPRGNYEPAIEIYTPPYLFDANDHPVTNRPTITGISSQVLGYNAPLSVTYTSSSAISSAVLIHLGSSTHAFDMDQRLIGLCGPAPQPSCTGSGTLSLTTPPNGNIAPPGYYMLFILDSAGVPSIAAFVQLSPYATTPPRGTITSPASDVVITAGQSVSFGTTSTAAMYSWIFPTGSPGSSTAQNPGNITFNTPGSYVASLTIIDSSGNSDPSPPTRTITVMPANPDFDITVGPSAQTILTSQSATFTVTVTPKSGFAGAVNLTVGSENGFPTGVTSGGFSPASITAGSGTATLTMNSTTSAIPYALSLTITGTSGSTTHTASTTLLINLASPASLTATGGSGQVALSWPPSTAATGYHVERALISGGPYVTVACPTTTAFTDTAVTNGTTYYYVVSASYTGGPNTGGESADSSEASANVQGTADTQPPTSPGNLTAMAVSSAQLNLSWTASTDNVGVTGYLIERCQGTACTFAQIATTSGTATTYNDTGLAANTTYSYRVRATDAASNLSNYSNIATAATLPLAPPATPTNVSASPGNPKGSINVTWVQSVTPGVTQNRIYRRSNSGSYSATPTAQVNATTSYLDRNLTTGATYCYVVTAVSAGGESAQSTPEACSRAK
jgi:fibronectin type 3 domain-containing protein